MGLIQKPFKRFGPDEVEFMAETSENADRIRGEALLQLLRPPLTEFEIQSIPPRLDEPGYKIKRAPLPLGDESTREASWRPKSETRSDPLYKSAWNAVSEFGVGVGRGLDMLIDKHLFEPARLKQEQDLIDQEYRRKLEEWKHHQPAVPGTKDNPWLPTREEERELPPTQQASATSTSSWGPEQQQPTIRQGGENILEASRNARQLMRDAATRKGTGFENTWPGKAVGTVVDIINPLPSGKTDVALAAIPFAKIMDRSRGVMGQMLRQSEPLIDEHIRKVISPKVMAMVSRANKDGFEHMATQERARWLDQYMTRVVRDSSGKWHDAIPGELHQDAIARLTKAGVPFGIKNKLPDASSPKWNKLNALLAKREISPSETLSDEIADSLAEIAADSGADHLAEADGIRSAFYDLEETATNGKELMEEVLDWYGHNSAVNRGYLLDGRDLISEEVGDELDVYLSSLMEYGR